jgi:hypothetical protein
MQNDLLTSVTQHARNDLHQLGTVHLAGSSTFLACARIPRTAREWRRV